LSEYLVGCLSPAGYLDCPLDELSAELGCPLFDLEQALFVVQSLEPTGVGARSLSECLLLQLAQSRHFTELNIHLVRRGLPKLADGDYAALAEDLHATEDEVRAAADYIRTLNPLPSRGFPTGSYTHYVVPEATLHWEGDTLHIDMNTAAQPRVSLNTETAGLLEAEDTREAQVYLRRKLQDARSLMDSLQDRQDTLFRLISAVARLQSGFFARGEALQPMTMSQVAEELNVNISTVSRAVKDKYIQYSGKVYSLRSLFSAAIASQDGGEISADGARRQIQRCVEAEDPAHPLSDSAICAALAALNISLSRRTVAKYRAELGIPPASKRRVGAGK
jgi:RNA polymerase sigma-54 factor